MKNNNGKSKLRFGKETKIETNKAGYAATLVACGWTVAMIEVSGVFGQEQ